MELFIGLAGVALGLFGSIFSVVLSVKQKKQSRLDFLVNIIIDEDIPRESRRIFYDEYVALGGNGSVNKFWLRGEKGK
ncbi:MAG: hypothetical protein LBG95_08085 [Treponema sp.]|jgi:hypothetical protein|nr:hypothetical protein [Treponema sp.]